MSILLGLVCRETKQYLWIGQKGNGEWRVWNHPPELTEKLARFILATEGRPIVALHEYEVERLEDSIGPLEEFEPDPDD